MKHFILIANGDIQDFEAVKNLISSLPPAACILCADGGLRYAEALGLFPDVIIGDFDSVDRQLLGEYERNGAELYALPREKDFTDTKAAVEYAIDRGAESITLIAAVGNRFDHSYGNIMLLYDMLQRGVDGLAANDRNMIGLCGSRLVLYGKTGATVSLLPFMGEALLGTVTGVKYPASGLRLLPGYPIGVSNEITTEEAVIEVERGIVMWVLAKD